MKTFISSEAQKIMEVNNRSDVQLFKEMKERKYAETKIINHETFKKYRFMSFEARPTDKIDG